MAFCPAAGFKAERNYLSHSRFNHQKAEEFYAELCLPGCCGWDTRAPTFGQHAQWGTPYHGCQTARQNCWVTPDEIALVMFKRFPASRLVEAGIQVDKSGERWMI